MLRVTIKTDNDAFHPEPSAELARLLFEVSAAILRAERDGPIYDVNGNRVGDFKLTGRTAR